MFTGHYGVSFAAKPFGRGIPLWVWFIAVQWMDIVWSVLVFLGIEKLHIVPNFTQANAYDLYYMPYTHGLPGSMAISVALGAVVALFFPRHRAKTLLLVAAASFSHWILDLIVHVPDLPLYDNSDKVGLGLWRHVRLSLPLELIFLGLGAWLYARRATFAGVRGRYAFGAFVIFLAVIQVYANLGPPPTSTNAMAATALAMYIGLALLAGWVERMATARLPQPAARAV